MSRRAVLRNGAAAAGAVTPGGAATGTAAGRFVRSEAGSSQKRGGRAQSDGEVRRHEPFRLVMDGADERNASCTSSESAPQTYLTYSIEYCASDDDADATMYVIPDEAELVEDEVYAIRSVRPCRESELDKVAFGPVNEEC